MYYVYAYHILLGVANVTLLKLLLQANDPLKDTDDVPVVTVPRSDDQTSDGVNQNTNNPTVSYITTYVASAGIMLCVATCNELLCLIILDPIC